MFSGRQFYPEEIILVTNVTDENLQAAMNYLLSGNAKHGCKLRLNDNHFTLAQTDILLKALADDRCPAGVEIFLDTCHLNDAYANKFAELFTDGHYPANLRLNFFGNNITDAGLIAMLNALNRDIERPGVFLNMQRNDNLSDACVLAFNDLIATNQIADGVGIDFSMNSALTRNALVNLAETIKQNTAVTELSLNLLSPDDWFENNDMLAMLMLRVEEIESRIKLCCERNRLLQKYRDNPDLIYQIHRLSKARDLPLACPDAEENSVPSLRFFAASKVRPADLQTFLDNYDGGFENLRDLYARMQNNEKTLDPNGKSRGCPWPCNIL